MKAISKAVSLLAVVVALSLIGSHIFARVAAARVAAQVTQVR
jgi:hypothetical protein